MPKPDESRDEALTRLDARLNAFEAKRMHASSPSAFGGMEQGYRFLGEVVGGVLGGTGLGWLLDVFAGTKPLGLIGGLLIGTGLSIFVAVRTAARMTKSETASAEPAPDPSDEDED